MRQLVELRVHAKSIIVYNGTYFKVFHHEGERAKAREKERDRDCSIVVVCVCSKYYTPPPFCRKLLPPPPPPPRPRWQKLSCARFGDVCFAIVTFCSCTNSNTVQHGMPSLFPSFPTIAMGRSSPSGADSDIICHHSLRQCITE